MTTTKSLGVLLAALCLCPLLAAALPVTQEQILFDDSHPKASSNYSGAADNGGAISTDYISHGIVFGRAGVSAGSDVHVNGGAGGTAHGICGLDAAGNIVINCTGDQYFNFVTTDQAHKAAVTANLSFAIGDTNQDVDSWIIHVYDASNVELEARAVSTKLFTTVTFAYGGINRLWVQWTGPTGPTASGYFIDTIVYDTTALPATVPEPATLGLVGLGLAALTLRRRARA